MRPTIATGAELRRRTRRSFLAGAIAAAAGFGSWHWLRTRRMDDGADWPIRRMLNANSDFARDYFSNRRGEEYQAGTAPKNPRVNENIGMTGAINLNQWRLNVTGLGSGNGHAAFTLADIQSLPKVETTMRLCCIEGWSILVNWGGARFADFAARVAPHSFEYVGMSTPDGEYYIGLDAAAAMHPQTLLCYEIDGEPLSLGHGAPLRLVIPSKYGIKNIKRIGTIAFAAQKPADYWAQRGYDWYAGL